MHIVCVIGSNYDKSIGAQIILNIVKSLGHNYTYEILDLKNLNTQFCLGCGSCFNTGLCPLDSVDDLSFIKNTLKSADIIILYSPVYVLSVSGLMKNLIDRCVLYFHTLELGGKLGFTITSTFSTGGQEVVDYLKLVQTAMGIKNLDNYIYRRVDNNIDEFILRVSKEIDHKIKLNVSYSNFRLEEMYQMIKNKVYYSQLYKYELEYWRKDDKLNFVSYSDFIHAKLRHYK